MPSFASFSLPHPPLQTPRSESPLGFAWQLSSFHIIVLLCIYTELFRTMESEVTQLRPSLCDPMDCSLSGFSVQGIFQARVLEWVAISFSRGSSQPTDRIQVSCIAGRRFNLFLYHWPWGKLLFRYFKHASLCHLTCIVSKEKPGVSFYITCIFSLIVFNHFFFLFL